MFTPVGRDVANGGGTPIYLANLAYVSAFVGTLDDFFGILFISPSKLKTLDALLPVGW